MLMQDAAVAEAITDESITFKGENIAANRVFHTKRFTNPKPSTPKSLVTFSVSEGFCRFGGHGGHAADQRRRAAS